jgi:hypothetical protein
MNGRMSMGMGLSIELRTTIHITPCLRRSRDQRPERGGGAPWRERRRDSSEREERRAERSTPEGAETGTHEDP